MARERVTNDAADANPPNPKLGERLQQRFLRPAKPGEADGWEIPTGVAELEEANRRASDKERLVGAFGAPLGAAIAILVVRTLVSRDPSQYLANGQLNPKHVSVNLYGEDLVVLLVLSLVILGFSMWRKRLPMALGLALFGLTIFNLHYWGFGIPYILAAAWLLVRTYRLSHALKVENGVYGTIEHPGRPRSNKRYTPPNKR